MLSNMRSMRKEGRSRVTEEVYIFTPHIKRIKNASQEGLAPKTITRSYLAELLRDLLSFQTILTLHNTTAHFLKFLFKQMNGPL